MESVKVRRTGISADDAAQVLRDGLGGSYEIRANGEGLLVSDRGIAKRTAAVIGEAVAFRDDG